MSGLTDARIIYGIHSIAPYHRNTHLPYGILKVIGSCNISLSSDLELLYAGSAKFPLAAEAKTIASEISAKVKAYPGFLFELFLGATVTDNSPDASGTIENYVNVKGTSIKDATNGLSAITAATAANLKYGKYKISATGAGTAKLYLMSDVDIKRGADIDYVDDSLEIASIDISVATDSHATTIGLSFTKAGTPAFVTGDSAEFEVRTPSSRSSVISVGKSTTTFPAFGMLMMAQKRATNEYCEITAHNVVANGLPISFEENAYSQPEVKMTCLYDAAKDEVFSIRTLTEA
jgi:hypothetical protein